MNVQAPPRPRAAPSSPIGNDPRPIVAVPNAGLPGIAIVLIAAFAAVILFLVLDGQRRRAALESAEGAQMQPGVFTAPPPLTIPLDQPAPTIVTIPFPEPVPAPRPQPRMAPPITQPIILPSPPLPAPPLPAPQVESGASTAPALIFDAGAGNAAPGAGGAPIVQMGPPAPGGPAAGPQRPGRTSLAQAPARPGRIANQTNVVPTGTLIRAVLETPIDTARPGLARAIVSQDARGFNGQRVLVPRGSRLIGEYESEVRTGQNKVLVNWIQLVRPDGTTIRLDSPAADAMGGAGVPGRVNTFFFQRFLNAVFQTALAVGPSLVLSNDADVVVGYPTSAITNVAGQAGGGLMGQTPQPKITVKQGTLFNVFVARDLDFSSAPYRR